MTPNDLGNALVDELARVISDPGVANVILSRAGYPRAMIPPFDTALVFWTKVVESISSGAMAGGIRPLIEGAASLYPGNATFAQCLAEASPRPSARKGPPSKVRSSIDYLIVTALDLEAEAVLGLLDATDEEIDVNGTLVEVAMLEDIRLGIVTTGPGNSSAATMTASVVTKLAPMGLIFIGIAGGIKDVKIGDVVAGTKIYGYESGKITDEGFFPRPEIARSDHAFVQRARFIGRKKQWHARASIEHVDEPRSFIAPIAAGEKVVASSESEVARRLRSTYGDAIAVEMEGIGALEAAHQTKTPGLVVRGISDLLDGKSNADEGGSQPRAATNAAAFALELILNYHRAQSTHP